MSPKLNLAAIKDSRKQAELDSKLLANRIALLQQEEDRAKKKVDLLLKQTQVVNQTRQREERKQREREEQSRERMTQIKHIQEQYQQQRELAALARDEAKRKHENEKKAEVMRLKEEHAAAARVRQEMDEELREYNVSRSKEIRNQQKIFKQKQAEEQARKIEEAQLGYARKIQEEEAKRKQYEALVARLEAQELVLIEKLQQTHLKQRDVCQQLDSALNGSLSKAPDAAQLFNSKSFSTTPQTRATTPTSRRINNNPTPTPR